MGEEGHVMLLLAGDMGSDQIFRWVELSAPRSVDFGGKGWR